MIRRCPLGRVEVWVLRGDFGLAIRVSSGARVGEPGGFLLASGTCCEWEKVFTQEKRVSVAHPPGYRCDL